MPIPDRLAGFDPPDPEPFGTPLDTPITSQPEISEEEEEGAAYIEAERLALEEEEEDYFSEEDVYMKYIVDQVDNLPDLIGILRAVAQRLEDLVTAGWTLTEPVDGGFVHLTRPPVSTKD